MPSTSRPAKFALELRHLLKLDRESSGCAIHSARCPPADVLSNTSPPQPQLPALPSWSRLQPTSFPSRFSLPRLLPARSPLPLVSQSPLLALSFGGPVRNQLHSPPTHSMSPGRFPVLPSPNHCPSSTSSNPFAVPPQLCTSDPGLFPWPWQ